MFCAKDISRKINVIETHGLPHGYRQASFVLPFGIAEVANICGKEEAEKGGINQ